MTGISPNQSTGGKIAAVIIAVVAVVAIWAWLGRNGAVRDVAEPLPGAGPGDRCAIWFIGSSTMYRWTDVVSDMSPWPVVRRGVNGANFDELTQRLSHDPARVPPRAIVLYAGENDIAAGHEVAEVYAGLRSFLAVKERLFANVPVILISLKPSPTRWGNRPKQLAYNALIRDLAGSSSDMHYVEIGPLLMDHGRPGKHYARDGIHLDPDGYKLLAPVFKEALAQYPRVPGCSQ